TPAAKRAFTALANELLDPGQASAFNQAMMDFGASICTPARPLCADCPFQPDCVAFQTGQVAELPRKAKATAKKHRFFIYGVFRYQDFTFLQQRQARDIWQNLYEFPLLELPGLPDDFGELPGLLLQHWFPQGRPNGIAAITVSQAFRQTLSHRVVTAVFCEFVFSESVSAAFFDGPPFVAWRRISRAEMKKNIAVPRLIDWYLQDLSLTLSL
ncbi:MAG: NUDIX domain-containing protein, partial [Saprospiraceae bacterium]